MPITNITGLAGVGGLIAAMLGLAWASPIGAHPHMRTHRIVCAPYRTALHTCAHVMPELCVGPIGVSPASTPSIHHAYVSACAHSHIQALSHVHVRMARAPHMH